MKKKDEIVTKSYLNQRFVEFGEEIERRFSELNEKFDKLFVKLDWFMGKYTKLEEEQTLQSGKLSEITDRLKAVEQKVGVVVE